MKWTQIEKVNFDKSEAILLFDYSQYARCYGIVSYFGKEYKFSWASDMIVPSVSEINSSIFYIGIDHTFVMYDCSINKILLKIEFDWFLCSIVRCADMLFVNTEFEVLEISLTRYVIVGRYCLPDIFDNLVISDNEITITCMDGRVQAYTMSTNQKVIVKKIETY